MPLASPPATDRAVDAVIVFALELEAAPTIKLLQQRRKTIGNQFIVYDGSLAGRRVAILLSGVGAKRLRTAADALLFAHCPRWLVAAGFAVGLSVDARSGDVLLASEIVDEAEGHATVTAAVPARSLREVGLRTGRFVSVGKLPRRADRKRELAGRTHAVAADLQSFTLAKLCGEQETEFLAVRVLTEDVAADAEPESLAVYHPSRVYRAGGLVGAFLSGSGHASRIRKLRATARRHAARLAGVLVDLLPRLP